MVGVTGDTRLRLSKVMILTKPASVFPDSCSRAAYRSQTIICHVWRHLLIFYPSTLEHRAAGSKQRDEQHRLPLALGKWASICQHIGHLLLLLQAQMKLQPDALSYPSPNTAASPRVPLRYEEDSFSAPLALLLHAEPHYPLMKNVNKLHEGD